MGKKKVGGNKQKGAFKAALLDLLDEYRLTLQVLNRSPRTISGYSEVLKRYFDFLESNSLLKMVDEMGKTELKAYVAHLQEVERWADCPKIKGPTGKLSPHSIRVHVRTIKAFWNWMLKEDFIPQNTVAKFGLPSAPQKPKPILNVEQVGQLLHHIDSKDPMETKYRAIVALLYDTGMRIGGLVTITMQNLNLPHNIVLVHEKGDKWHPVPFSDAAKKDLLHYVNHSRSKLGPVESPYLFPTPKGDHISINSVQQYLRRLGVKAGLEGVKVSPHVFRHTNATHSAAAGAELEVLQQILGHASPTTTAQYIHLTPEDLQAQHAHFSPYAKLLAAKNKKKKT